MSAQLTNNPIAERLAISLHGVADITGGIPRDCGSYSTVERLFGTFHQQSLLFRHMSYRKSVGIVAVIAVQVCTTIHRDDISLIEQHSFLRDTVDHHIIHREAEGSGKTIVSFEGWHTAMVSDIGLRDSVEIEQRNSRFDVLGHFGQSFSNKQRTFLYYFNFLFAFQANFVEHIH